MGDVVFTGIGIVSPIGIGRGAFWASLREGASGIRPLEVFVESNLPSRIGGQIVDFEPKEYVRPRKSLKVMSREIQLAYAAADLAWHDAGLGEQSVDPERCGVISGCDMLYSDLAELVPVYESCMPGGQFDMTRWGTHGMKELFPLWMLQYLPNMPACHISISRDARGPCNSIVQGEISSLLAVIEGAAAIRRGFADVMLVGGVGTRLQATSLVWRGDAGVSHRNEDPAAACRPFDLDRDGMVNGEGAALFVLESEQHARARGAEPLAHIVGKGNTFEAADAAGHITGRAIRRSIESVLQMAGWSAGDVGHVNAHGLSTREHDAVEAQAIAAVLDDVPVTAPKSYFGNSGAATGAMELAASVLAVREGVIPPTLNYERPDPACPVRVVADKPQPSDVRTAIALNQATLGQAVAIGIERS